MNLDLDGESIVVCDCNYYQCFKNWAEPASSNGWTMDWSMVWFASSFKMENVLEVFGKTFLLFY